MERTIRVLGCAIGWRLQQVIHWFICKFASMKRTFGKLAFLAYLGDAENNLLLYDFTDSREREGPVNFLQGFEGFLQDCIMLFRELELRYMSFRRSTDPYQFQARCDRM